MSKYRIIKSIAASEDAPYYIQKWDTKQLTWAAVEGHQYTYSVCVQPLHFETIKKAKAYINQLKHTEEILHTAAEVVWEESNEI